MMILLASSILLMYNSNYRVMLSALIKTNKS